MAMAVSVAARPQAALSRFRSDGAARSATRAILLAVIGAAILCGILTTGTDSMAQAVAQAGTDLTRLLRFMAALKALMAAAAAGAVLWRLGAGITLPWFLAYALICAAMAAGPGLIWTMAHVGAGALLLHGGLLVTVLLLWHDPIVAERLAARIAARRSRLGQAAPKAKG